MAILDRLTLGDIEIITVDSDPTTGIVAPPGSIIIRTDIPKMYFKYGAANDNISQQLDTSSPSSISGVGTITSGVWNGTTINELNGGTGQTSYITGDLLYASNTNTLNKLSAVASGNALISSGINTAPQWGKINLTSHITGILSVSNGGTGTSAQLTQNSIILAGTSGIYTEDTTFTYNTNTKQLALTGTDTTILLNSITTEPTPPINNNLLIYAKSIAGRVVPKWVSPSGVDNVFQSNLFLNNISLISPGSGTTLSTLGCVVTNVGTVSHTIPTSTSLKTQTRRFSIASAFLAPSYAETRPGVLECWRGNTSTLGGFFFSVRFSFDTLRTGNCFFTGLIDTISALTNFDPTTSSTNSKIGIAINTNSGNLNIIHNNAGTAPTIIPLGVNFPINTTNLYELILYAAPNSSTVGYRVTNLSNNQQTSGTISSNLPANTVFLARRIWMTNNATNGSISFSCNIIGLETDY
jgi:hypothetical protein